MNSSRSNSAHPPYPAHGAICGRHFLARLLSLKAALSLLLMATSGLLRAADDPDALWNAQLRDYYFEGADIAPGDEVLSMDAPVRAEDGAVVPVSIRAAFPQSTERYIRAITLLVDENPVPMAGRFEFTPESGRADLDLRIRVNAYSQVRAIAETSDGGFYMASRFVKASGGCSAPVGTDLDQAMQRIGKVRFRLRSEYSLDEPVQLQMAVSHPNLTGLQKDQVTTLFIPPHFVRRIRVTFDGREVMTATTDISISENPNLRFYFRPEKDGEIVAEIEDSEGMSFRETYDYRKAG